MSKSDLDSFTGVMPDPLENSDFISHRYLKEGLPQQMLQSLNGRWALVVDDDSLSREVACDFLSAVGMKVDTANDGLEALERIISYSYDVVLLDMQMPRLDGIGTIQELRRHESLAKLPVIALTAQAFAEDRNAGLEAGITAYLTKPIDDVVLYRTIFQALGGEPLTDISTPSLQQPNNEALTGFMGQNGEFDLSAAARRLGNNPERTLKLLRSFLNEFSLAPAEMQAHLALRDTAAISALAHKVKGAASYFDALEFCKTASILVKTAKEGDMPMVELQVPFFINRLTAALKKMKELMSPPTEMYSTRNNFFSPVAARLIEQAEPLVLRGDYAAQSLLDQIGNLLEGTSVQVLAVAARNHYEDLELEATVLFLRELKLELDKSFHKESTL